MPAVLREGHTPPPEQFLQQICQFQRIRRSEIRTTDGRRISVLHPGFMNLEAGPDFQQAYIQVGRAAPVECDVEIDVASGGWQQHGHHTNPAFSGVGLHVVWQAGNGGPTGLPVVELKDQLDRDKLTNRYLRTLWDQWWLDRDRLANRILPRDVWTFHGLRPANRPERRLALAACWLSRPDFVPWLDDWVCQTEKPGRPRRRHYSGTLPPATSTGRHTGHFAPVDFPRLNRCWALVGCTTSP